MTAVASDESEVGRAAKVQRQAFSEAASRSVIATYGPGEPPTSQAFEDQAESIFAFADSLDVGSATFRSQYAELLGDGRFTSFYQASIHAMQPCDAFEALLAAQMSAIHAAMMNLTGRLTKAEYLEHSKFYESAVNRLARTYAAQIEALRKHRGDGTQTVRHVHVNEGGQAVVADTVNHIRGGKIDEQIDD
ncbi:MAG: hypothetical protein P8Q48_18100 [Paracoccaceae bacterium]|nr:hypothetical protein [Paracoccaceae bacterium]